jgi:hypothetical protein
MLRALVLVIQLLHDDNFHILVNHSWCRYRRHYRSLLHFFWRVVVLQRRTSSGFQKSHLALHKVDWLPNATEILIQCETFSYLFAIELKYENLPWIAERLRVTLENVKMSKHEPLHRSISHESRAEHKTQTNFVIHRNMRYN